MTNDSCCHHQLQSASQHEQLPHLSRVGGKIEGIKKMIEDGRYCHEILTQLRTVRSAIKSVEVRILDTHLSSWVTEAYLSQDQNEQRKKSTKFANLLKHCKSKTKRRKI